MSNDKLLKYAVVLGGAYVIFRVAQEVGRGTPVGQAVSNVFSPPKRPEKLDLDFLNTTDLPTSPQPPGYRAADGGTQGPWAPGYGLGPFIDRQY